MKANCVSFIIFRQRSELINLQRSENNLFLNLIMQKMARDGSLPKKEEKLFKGGARSRLGPRVRAGWSLCASLIEHVLEETLSRRRSHLCSIPEMQGCCSASMGTSLVWSSLPCTQRWTARTGTTCKEDKDLHWPRDGHWPVVSVTSCCWVPLVTETWASSAHSPSGISYEWSVIQRTLVRTEYSQE